MFPSTSAPPSLQLHPARHSPSVQGSRAEPWPPSTGVLGRGQHPGTTQSLSAPTSTQGLCCFWGFSPQAGGTSSSAKGLGSSLAGSSW